MILLIEYFKHEDKERDREYLACLEENVNNNFITRIEIFIADDSVLPIKHDKININRLTIRPTYDFFFNFCNDKYPNKICIVSNADIIFDETLSHINEENIDNKLLALTRWDIKPNDKLVFFNRKDSQDCWIFKAPIQLQDRPDFRLGQWGCDNIIAYMAHKSGLVVTNPSKLIIIKHLHRTKINNHKENIIKGMYLWLTPTNNIERISRKKILNTTLPLTSTE